MNTVFTARDIEAIIATGADPSAAARDAVLTPSARDALRDYANARKNGTAKTSNTAISTSASAPAKPLNSKSPKAELDAFFNSAYCQGLKEQLCDIGRRMWQREYVDGNGGNLAIRVGEDIALCTPTLVSKGFMKPEDMCLVDFEGNQFCGGKKRTSEILMHLQIMKRQPRAVATAHCHPPYSTGFAVAGMAPPTCMIPEYEVFA
ncbi:MAG TPA: class II aldolase/adducin family protein, partial [Candidatus Acidoferrum sp.]|nr:class II aldolase/adducin family protein [Candidatus Acidoferrum sp.]